jgi:hypothetical protein
MKDFVLKTIEAKEKMDKFLLSIVETIIDAQQQVGLFENEIYLDSPCRHHSLSIMTTESNVYLTVVETEAHEEGENTINMDFPVEYLDMTLEEIHSEEKSLAKVIVESRNQSEIRGAEYIIKNAGGTVIWSNS